MGPPGYSTFEEGEEVWVRRLGRRLTYLHRGRVVEMIDDVDWPHASVRLVQSGRLDHYVTAASMIKISPLELLAECADDNKITFKILEDNPNGS